MSTPSLRGRTTLAWRTTVPFGLAAGTLYFIMIGALSVFTSVLGSEPLSLFGLVLFVGVGAALGLLLGAVTGVSLAAVAHRGQTVTTQRILGAAAGGVPVLVFTLWEYVTDTVGVLEPDVTTVIAVPTLVAAIGCAALAPRLAGGDQPKRPEM